MVSKLFQGKKNTDFCKFLLKKKIHEKSAKTPISKREAAAQPSEWLSNFSWEKKKQLVFFFLHKVKKKKNRENRVSEWR